MPRQGNPVARPADGEVTLLSTQFSPPPLPFGMVHRPRLAERLLAGLQEPVTLLSAPAGSGKTALLVSALASADRTVAWISLEPGDDDPARFWSAVLTALRHAGVAPPDSPLAMLAPPPRAAHARFATLFLNALAESRVPVVLVLDDVHLIRTRECLAHLSFLVSHAPPTLRLVLSSRADPPLPLHALRLRGRLADIRTVDLAFTVEETAELLAAHDLHLTRPQVTTLCTRAEGWAAGLRLAAMSLRGHLDPARFVDEFAGDERVVGEYLIAEVLDRQTPKLRAFLLRTAIVDSVCGELADALTGETSGAELLDRLERTNGFVLGANDHPRWYRYHRLFGQLLRARAKSELAGGLAPLHAQAARWYAEHQMAPEALRHAVAGEDWELAIEVTAEHWFELFVRGHGGALRSLKAALPHDRLEGDAELAAVLACAALEVGDSIAAKHHLALARAAADGLPAGRRRRYLEMLAVAALLRARLEGDFEAALRAADAVLAEAEDSWSDERRRALVHAQLGATALWAHRLDRAGEELHSAVTLARTTGLEHLQITALSNLALVRWMVDGSGAENATEAIALANERGWNRLPQTAAAHAMLAADAFYDLRVEEAAEQLECGFAVLERVRDRQIEFVLTHIRARMLGWLGRPQEGLRTLDEFALTHAHGGIAHFEEATSRSVRAHLLAIQGDLDGAEAVLAPVSNERWLAVTISRARLALARGAPNEALEVLENAGRARPTHSGTSVEAIVVLALAYDMSHGPVAAAAAVEDALEVAERTGHRWPFVEAGRRMEALLRKQIQQGTAHRAMAGELVDMLEQRAPLRLAVAPLLEPLSDREQAVLRFLPTRLSNHEIAVELFVTTNTIKTHLRSIYRKLDVGRRREAVERARELRLLAGSGR